MTFRVWPLDRVELTALSNPHPTLAMRKSTRRATEVTSLVCNYQTNKDNKLGNQHCFYPTHCLINRFLKTVSTSFDICQISKKDKWKNVEVQDILSLFQRKSVVILRGLSKIKYFVSTVYGFITSYTQRLYSSCVIKILV